MFACGDKVVYRHHVCEIAALREAYFEGRDYLELHALFEKSLKLFVAVDEAKPPACRTVMTREEALALIDTIGGLKPLHTEIAEAPGAPALLERHLRETYEAHLKTFTPQDLVLVLQSAHLRTVERQAQGRNATSTDKRYFDMAESFLCDELALSLDMPREDTKAYLESYLGYDA